VEIEAFAIANLVAKMENGQLPPAPIWSNLKTLPVEPFRGKVDLITGGYPCQPFSQAGKREGKDDSEGRHLWPYIKEIIRAVRPLRCFFENVEGHISLGLREVISDLESLGYKTTWGIFSAREVGAPHQRKRVFILADAGGARQQAQRDESRPQWQPQPTCESSELADSNSNQQRPWVRQEQSKRYTTGQCSSYSGTVGIEGVVADPDSAGCQQGHQEDAAQPSEQSDSGGFQSGNAANANSEGLEGRLQRGSVDTQGRQEQEIRYAAQRSNWRGGRGHSTWPAEPRVGRVVDGCANRVDRIRLLGNGVLPATAAKAWRVLNETISLC